MSKYFFINGMFTIIDDNYYMRFLTEFNSDINIIIYNDFKKESLLFKKCISIKKNLNIIDILIKDPELNTVGYKRYYYDINDLKNNTIWSGSFPLITPEYKESLKIVFLSCNDNLKKVPSWDIYHDGINSILWKEISKSTYDICIGMGDQIYADSVGQLWMNNKINIQQVKKYLHKLYVNTYSEINQSQVMRNTLNFTILDDHDIKDCYGTPNTKNLITNNHFDVYRNIAIKYFKKYQLNLINKKFNDNKYDYTYDLDIGKYKIIMYDMRNQLYKTGQIFSKNILSYTNNVLKNNKKENILIILPRPIGGTSKFFSWISGFYIKDCIDEPVHPHNLKNTQKFLNILFKCKNKTNFDIKILAGDVHECYSKSIEKNIDNNKLIINQYIASGITRSSRDKDMNWFVKKLTWFIDNYNNLSKLGIGKKNNHNITNNYGNIINDKVNLFTIK
jgi:hypothetical protein